MTGAPVDPGSGEAGPSPALTRSRRSADRSAADESEYLTRTVTPATPSWSAARSPRGCPVRCAAPGVAAGFVPGSPFEGTAHAIAVTPASTDRCGTHRSARRRRNAHAGRDRGPHDHRA